MVGAAPEKGMGLALRLGWALRHPTLFKAYPELYNFRCVLYADDQTSPHFTGPRKNLRQGSCDREQVIVHVKLGLTENLLLRTTLHEIQHRIQRIERFTGGSNVTAEFKKIMEERHSRIRIDNSYLRGPRLKAHLELLKLSRKDDATLRELIYGNTEIPHNLSPTTAPLFYRVRDYARARYRQTPGELEARQVEHEFTLTGELQREHITISPRGLKTNNRQSARLQFLPRLLYP